MATAAPSANQATDLLQKLSIDSQAKSLEIPEPTKKPSANQYVPVDSANVVNGHIPSSDRSMTPLLTDFADQPICYLPNGYAPYYYGGYECSGNEWDDYPRFVNPDGVEMTSGVYGDNGSLMYPHGYGFAPYSPYSPAASPVPTMGNDGQLYGPQHYQYPPYFQPMTPTSAPYTPSLTATQSEVFTSLGTDQKPLPVDTTNGNSNSIVNVGAVKGSNDSAPFKPTYQNSSVNSNGSYGRASLPARVPTPGYPDPRFGFDGVRSPIPWLDVPLFSDGRPRPVTSTTVSSISNNNNVQSLRNQNHRPNSQFMGLHQPRPMSGMSTAHGFINRMYPSKVYEQYGNAVRSGMGFGYHGYDSRASGRAWLSVDNKYNKPRGRNNGFYAYGNENMDGLNELNKGPRAKSNKNQKGFAPAITVKGQSLQLNATNDEVDKVNVTPNWEQYNNDNFPEHYTEVKIFIIKSYSEDDVHKSIKYNVWASTPNGNKKLHAAYQEAQDKSGGCPVFLFFSVNTSGQFVGLAEMVGPVDFNKSVEYWQQDKWNGCFPVKWHIVKDVPNSLLKHITLENNENKPVTNSRDTQEVKLEPGLKMIKIFKEYSSKTCILDDFGFYESRQKTIQEKKARQQFQKQVWEGKPVDVKKDVENGELNQKSLDDVSEPVKDPIPSVPAADNVKVEESVSVPTTVEAPKGAQPVVSEKRIVANGAANGY